MDIFSQESVSQQNYSVLTKHTFGYCYRVPHICDLSPIPQTPEIIKTLLMD